MEGTIHANQTWLVPEISKFRGNTQNLAVRIRKRKLAFGREQLQVPNLFAMIWARTRWALPFVGFWFWMLILAASSLGRYVIWGIGSLVVALFVVEALLWWLSLHVKWLVPAPRTNRGQLTVKSSGGERQIEVKVRAAPSPARRALGWATAATLMLAEIGALLWAVFELVGNVQLLGI